MNLDQRAERLTITYKAKRASHKPSKRVWAELVDLRKRAIRATTRRTKAVSDLPLFARVQ